MSKRIPTPHTCFGLALLTLLTALLMVYWTHARQARVDQIIELGNQYSLGDGVQPDKGKAFSYYLLAAEKGDARAESMAAWHLLSGKYVPKDVPRAIAFLNDAVRQGNPKAKATLAYCYHSGIGVTQNDATAEKLYTEAAEEDDRDAQSSLGAMYLEGARKDYAVAYKWISRAASNGSPAGQFRMGRICERGLGVNKDVAEALRWYQLAITNGYTNALKYYTRLNARTTNVTK